MNTEPNFGAAVALATEPGDGALGGSASSDSAAVSSTPLAVAGRAVALEEIVVKPHPAGGFTHARRERGAGCFVYCGNWPTAWAAARALASVASSRGLARDAGCAGRRAAA